ncbi:MAG TPA: Rpn family recombination-promoting nuclease/putative transposase [Allocoleopsis sp.]
MTEKKADIGGKKIMSLAPEAWVKWITNNPQVKFREILSSDFQWIARANDILMKVYHQEIGEFLLLNELQLRYNNKMPKRLRAYSGLAEEKYDLPVYPVLINILPNSNVEVIPTKYESEIMGIKAYQEYQVINLWEVDVNLVFEQKLSSLLPFVPILKGGDDETIIRRALRELQTDEKLDQLEPLLSFFASFVLEMPVVQQIMRWDMTVLRESPLYQEMIKEAETNGFQLGKAEGESNLIIRQIRRRLGEIEPHLELTIRQLSMAKLEELGDCLLDFSTMADLIPWLENNTDA